MGIGRSIFNVLENYSKRIVIKSFLKCYTSVTFGVQNASATNIVTVRVHRRFSFDSFFPKKKLAESVTFSKRAINDFTEFFVDGCAFHFFEIRYNILYYYS